MSARIAPIPQTGLSWREPLTLRRACGRSEVVGSVDWFGALQGVCATAGLTASQYEVVRQTCEGREPAEIAANLSLGVLCVTERLAAGVRKLARLSEKPELPASDRAAISRAMQGRKERDPDPDWDPSCHPRGEEKPRVQGMRPFGMLPEDLVTREAGPTYALLTTVCQLTGSRRPPLRLQAREVSDLVSVDGGNSWVERSA